MKKIRTLLCLAALSVVSAHGASVLWALGAGGLKTVGALDPSTGSYSDGSANLSNATLYFLLGSTSTADARYQLASATPAAHPASIGVFLRTKRRIPDSRPGIKRVFGAVDRAEDATASVRGAPVREGGRSRPQRGAAKRRGVARPRGPAVTRPFGADCAKAVAKRPPGASASPNTAWDGH